MKRPIRTDIIVHIRMTGYWTCSVEVQSRAQVLGVDRVMIEQLGKVDDWAVATASSS